MRSWKTRALAMMAQAIRRVCGTFTMPRQPGNRSRHARLGGVQLVQYGRDPLDAPLECVGSNVHVTLRNRHQPH